MPILDQRSLDFISHAPDQTARLGVRLGERLAPGDVICLSGELGSGKTTLAAGVGRGWGVLEPVTSPTFVLVNEYQRADGLRLWHLDCYRLRSGAEAVAFGFEDLLAGAGLMLIEWPEHIQEILPPERLHIHLRWVDTEKRGFRIEALGARYTALLHDFRHAAFG
ncbi:MAG: tRNA (adenosine(37)-N6)-threonylcarbamoyltransferase complex ATPase subunit type 1 TsaE [Anaerolineales bacterium]|nr:tRNA (adenosine(37)-N6)-threonylcarbamoyltransferase complex ATPase subunit type 1 TsaE [Anaerolineales bacterium]